MLAQQSAINTVIFSRHKYLFLRLLLRHYFIQIAQGDHQYFDDVNTTQTLHHLGLFEKVINK